MVREARLFNQVSWHRQIEAQRQTLNAKAQSFTASQFDAMGIDGLADDLHREFFLDIPVVSESEITVSQREIDLQIGVQDDFSWGGNLNTVVRGTAIIVTIPFTGDRVLFRVWPRWYSKPPFGEVRRGAIVFQIIGMDFAQESPKPRIDSNVKRIQEHLQWQRELLGDFNEAIRVEAIEILQRRKRKLDADVSVLEELGYKIS